MDSGPGKEDDPLDNAGQAFEQHEQELLEKLTARAQQGIPPGATVGEAIEEMQRAIVEDDDARELLERVAIIQSQNSGYIRSRFEQADAELADMHRQYTSAGPGGPLSREALDLMKELADELDRRLPSGISETEREAQVARLLQEDEELASLASRIERLTAGTWMAPPEEDPS